MSVINKKGAVAAILSFLIPGYLMLIAPQPISTIQLWTAVTFLVFAFAYIFGFAVLTLESHRNAFSKLRERLDEKILSNNTLQKDLADMSEQFSGHSDKIRQLERKIDDNIGQIEKATQKINRNATFLSKGFIEVQRYAVSIEQAPVSQDSIRYAIHNHIPSHIRETDLEDVMAKKIYENWEPRHLISVYQKLINERSHALDDYLEKGGVFYDFFTKKSFEQYLYGKTQFDPIQDPVDEILVRLRKLRSLLKHENYNLSIMESNDLGPSMLLRIDRTGESVDHARVLVDLRTPGHSTNFETRSYGIYSDDIAVCLSTQEKLTRNMKQTDGLNDKSKIITKLDKLIKSVGSSSEKQEFSWD